MRMVVLKTVRLVINTEESRLTFQLLLQLLTTLILEYEFWPLTIRLLDNFVKRETRHWSLREERGDLIMLKSRDDLIFQLQRQVILFNTMKT